MRFDVRQVQSTTSTNDDAKIIAEQGGPEGIVVWALHQTAGRGRQGRQWQSPEGNLYFSLVLRPLLSPHDFGQYSFLAALALSDALGYYLPHAKIQLKWPNDVLVEDKKVSGVLLEAIGSALVMGIGLNVQHMPSHPLYPATSLFVEKAASLKLDDILGSILKSIAFWDERLKKDGFVLLRKAWLERARKGSMRVKLPSQREIEGDFSDLDVDGNLHLILKDGTSQIIRTGDVFF